MSPTVEEHVVATRANVDTAAVLAITDARLSSGRT